MKTNNPVLLLEDDQVDFMAIKRAFKELKITNQLVVCENGEEGLKYLNSAESKKPCLILLDINMPKMNGIEFLKIIKKDSQFKCLPVVVLTSSKEAEDKFDSFGMGVAGYILKPADHKKVIEVVQTINLYWTLSEQP